MSKNNQLGPVIEQRQFIFEGHGFWVPLRIGQNVRFAKDQIKRGKRRSKAKGVAGRKNLHKRVVPTKYFKFPPTPEWVKQGMSRKEYEDRQNAHNKYVFDLAPAVVRNIQAGLIDISKMAALNLFSKGDVEERLAAMRELLDNNAGKKSAFYYSHSFGAQPRIAETSLL